MNLILFIVGCLAIIAIILVFLLHATFPTKRLIMYLPSIISIVAGIVLIPASRFIGIGMGLGLVGLVVFVTGVALLLLAIIVDILAKK